MRNLFVIFISIRSLSLLFVYRWPLRRIKPCLRLEWRFVVIINAKLGACFPMSILFVRETWAGAARLGVQMNWGSTPGSLAISPAVTMVRASAVSIAAARGAI
jgi:hypothetical protein